jgi:hypothetical protein
MYLISVNLMAKCACVTYKLQYQQAHRTELLKFVIIINIIITTIVMRKIEHKFRCIGFFFFFFHTTLEVHG